MTATGRVQGAAEGGALQGKRERMNESVQSCLRARATAGDRPATSQQMTRGTARHRRQTQAARRWAAPGQHRHPRLADDRQGGEAAPTLMRHGLQTFAATVAVAAEAAAAGMFPGAEPPGRTPSLLPLLQRAGELRNAARRLPRLSHPAWKLERPPLLSAACAAPPLLLPLFADGGDRWWGAAAQPAAGCREPAAAGGAPGPLPPPHLPQLPAAHLAAVRAAAAPAPAAVPAAALPRPGRPLPQQRRRRGQQLRQPPTLQQ